MNDLHPCPNCEATMNDGDACPECDHNDAELNCQCQACCSERGELNEEPQK